MPRDKRLYMTFPNDFWQHPKMAILSDAAFRTFVELVGYSRMQDLDGRIPAATVRKLWKPKPLKELLSNHPERPTLFIDGDDFVIWNYSEHQQTRADRERLAEVSRSNGAKGGRPPKNPEETQRGFSGNPDGTQPKAESESESESESETDVTDVNESSHLLDTTPISDSDSSAAHRIGIHNLASVRSHLVKATGQQMSAAGAVELSRAILSRSKREVRRVDAYIATTCRNTPAEVAQAYFDLDIEGVR